MRVLVTGATGVIGRGVVAALSGRGHEVAGLTRTPDGADLLSALGAEPFVADVLDADSTSAAVLAARPDVVVDQLTALPGRYDLEAMRRAITATGAVRTTGGDHVYAAAVAAGARRYLAQSGCSFYRPGEGLADESEPWAEQGPPLVAENVRSLLAVERRTVGADRPLAGASLRYGFFYGPGTWFHPDGDVADQVRAGQYPVVGTGAALWSWVHVDDAVAATVAALESDLTGPVNICDDEPLPLARWLPDFARSLDAPPPPRVPAGPGTDPDGRFYAESLRGASNQRARAELGFRPRALGWEAASSGALPEPVPPGTGAAPR